MDLFVGQFHGKVQDGEVLGDLPYTVHSGNHKVQARRENKTEVEGHLSKGAAGSWQMDNRWKAMMEGKYDFGFAVNWMRKDLDIAIAEARKNGAHLPMSALVDQFYSEVQRLGGGRWDTCSLLARLNNQKA